MSETKARVAMSRSTVDGAVCRTKFFIGGVDSEQNVVREHNTGEFPSGIQSMLCAYGMSAAAKAQYHGTANSSEEALDLYDRFVASLRDGSWSPGRSASEAGPSILVLAIERYEQKHPNAEKHDRQTIEDTVNALSPSQKRSLHSSAELATHIRDIKVEQANAQRKAAKPSPNLLGSLFGAPVAQAAE